MNIKNQEVKEKLIQRMKRIEGQMRGVQNMVEEERDCREIMQQLAAIHSAVQGVSRVFLQEYATTCLSQFESGGQDEAGTDLREKRRELVQDMIALLDKTP